MLDRRREIDPAWFQRSRMLEGRAFAAIRRLAEARRALPALRSGGQTELVPTGNRSVLAYCRVHPRSAPFLSVTNFSDVTQPADAGIIARAGVYRLRPAHSTTGELAINAGRIELSPWSFAWLTGESPARSAGARSKLISWAYA